MMKGEGFPHEAMVKNFSAFRRHLGDGGELLVTYDSNADPAPAMAANENRHFSNFVTGLMYDVNRCLKTGGDFDPAAWEHQMQCDRRVKVIHHCNVATKAQTFQMEDREYRFQRGERFVEINCFKYHEAVFDELSADAGYQPLGSVEYKTMRLQRLSL